LQFTNAILLQVHDHKSLETVEKGFHNQYNIHWELQAHFVASQFLHFLRNCNSGYPKMFLQLPRNWNDVSWKPVFTDRKYMSPMDGKLQPKLQMSKFMFLTNYSCSQGIEMMFKKQ
jgi:hypothetical protein